MIDKHTALQAIQPETGAMAIETGAMVIEAGTAFVLAYVLVSMGVTITFLFAVLVVGWFIGHLGERRGGQRREEQ
jgi:hypothetical protein